MRRRQSSIMSERVRRIILVQAVILAFGMETTFARPPEAILAANVPCAVLEKFGGQVQILDSTRTNVLNTEFNTGVPCGGWISVLNGWAKIKDQKGNRFWVNSGSFIQFSGSESSAKDEGESVVLFKGQVYAEAASDREIRVITTNSRVRLPRTSGVITYSEELEETQLIVIEATGYLANRFQETAEMPARAGEATSLNTRALRVMPSTPRAVAMAPVKQLLMEMNLDERDVQRAVKVIRERQDRKFASLLEGAASNAEPKREPSGLVTEEEVKTEAVKKKNAKIQEHLAKKIVGGQEAGEKILFPEKFHGQPQKVRLQVNDSTTQATNKRKQQEDAEKARLMKELSEVEAD